MKFKTNKMNGAEDSHITALAFTFLVRVYCRWGPHNPVLASDDTLSCPCPVVLSQQISVWHVHWQGHRTLSSQYHVQQSPQKGRYRWRHHFLPSSHLLSSLSFFACYQAPRFVLDSSLQTSSPKRNNKHWLVSSLTELSNCYPTHFLKIDYFLSFHSIIS